MWLLSLLQVITDRMFNILVGNFVLCWFECFGSQRRVLSPADTSTSQNFHRKGSWTKLPTGLCGFLSSVTETTGKKEVISLTEMSDFLYWKYITLLQKSGVKKDYVCYPRNPLGYLLIFPCLILLKSNNNHKKWQDDWGPRPFRREMCGHLSRWSTILA